MKLLLKTTIDKLGKRGEVVRVANGYGRNYLIPQGFAVEPTSDNLLRLESEKQKYEAQMLAEKGEFEELAAKLSAVSCTVTAKADENGHLYGSVSEAMIAEAFAGDGIELDPKTVVMPEEHIKELGVYEISVKLHPEVSATTKVWVVEEN